MTFLEKALGFNPKTMRLKTEVIAGATTFLTMSYILAVNPAVLSSIKEHYLQPQQLQPL